MYQKRRQRENTLTKTENAMADNENAFSINVIIFTASK